MHLPAAKRSFQLSVARNMSRVSFELVKDPEAPSGYLWTSLKGPNKQVRPGSMVTGFAIKERIAPIEKVFYKIKNVLRSR